MCRVPGRTQNTSQKIEKVKRPLPVVLRTPNGLWVNIQQDAGHTTRWTHNSRAQRLIMGHLIERRPDVLAGRVRDSQSSHCAFDPTREQSFTFQVILSHVLGTPGSSTRYCRYCLGCKILDFVESTYVSTIALSFSITELAHLCQKWSPSGCQVVGKWLPSGCQVVGKLSPCGCQVIGKWYPSGR